MARRVQLRVAYSSTWAEQSDFGVPLTSGEMDAVLVTKEGGQSHIVPVFTTEDLNDCTTQYLVDLIIRHRLARLTLDLEVDKEMLAGLSKFAMGAQAGNNITMLAPTTFILPATSFVVGFDDGEDPGILLSDAVCESLTISGQIDQKFSVRAVFVGRGDMPDADHVFAECQAIIPLRFEQNASLIWNSVEYILKTRRITLTYNNQLPLTDFPFSLGSVDISRPLERGNKHVVTLDCVIEGRPNDALGRQALTIPPTHADFLLHIGEDGITYQGDDGMIRPGSGDMQVWDGEVALACLNLQITPIRIPGDAGSPMNAVVD